MELERKMSYRINYRGLEVAVDTLDEIDALADRLELKGKNKGTRTTIQSSPPASIADVINAATTDQKKLLLHLIENGEVSDAELRSVVGVDDNKQIAGMTAGLSKRLKAASIDGQLIQNESRFENGQRVYKYWIPAEVVEDVKKGLGMEV